MSTKLDMARVVVRELHGGRNFEGLERKAVRLARRMSRDTLLGQYGAALKAEQSRTSRKTELESTPVGVAIVRKTHDEFVADAHDRGHFRGYLGEAAAAIVKTYNRADLNNRRTLLAQLVEAAEEYARVVKGFDESATEMGDVLTRQLRPTDKN